MDICHIRQRLEVGYRVVCGENYNLDGRLGETISLEHFRDHVLVTKDDCCKLLYERLCPECVQTVMRG